MAEPPLRVSPIDVRLEVIAIALEPALTLARAAAIPLDDLQRLVAAGYFREARARGMSFRTIARRFDRSLRTITNLSKLANEQGLPRSTSQRITWRRQLAELVSQRGGEGIDVAALFAAVGGADTAVLKEELQQLVETGILTRNDEQVKVSARHFDLVQEDLAPRLESFRHFLRAVAAVAYSRFFVVDPRAEAFARVLSFTAERSELGGLREGAYEALRSRVFAADAHADGDGDRKNPARTTAAMAAFCVVETPDDPAWRPPR